MPHCIAHEIRGSKMHVVARPKKKARRSVTYRLPEVLLDQLDKLVEETRRPATTELEIALEAHLRKAKLWPVNPESEDD